MWGACRKAKTITWPHRPNPVLGQSGPRGCVDRRLKMTRMPHVHAHGSDRLDLLVDNPAVA